MDIIVGTAGHIDHGKTALVKSLTGIDADRLPEEKQRGITIDIGFAELEIGGVRFGFVDVPGHERFIKNMLAGATGIDLVLLVIAADESIMPQTREHFEICRLLDIKAGLIVLTKADLVDSELLELVKLEAMELVDGSFLQDAPVIATSAKTGEGIRELKQALIESSRMLPARRNDLVMRLPVDRSFTMKGFGAVVTGTLVTSVINESDELELMPGGQKVRVRGLQTHGQTVKKVFAGQRVAVNLGGIDHLEIKRGMVLSERGVLRPTQIFDAGIEVLATAKKALRSRQRVRVHIGTEEALARVQVLNLNDEIKQGESDLVQLRLEIPVIALPDDRFIIRSYSPQMTIAGGRVIDALAIKHRRKELSGVRDFLNKLLAAKDDITRQVELYLDAAGRSGLTFADLQARTAWLGEVLAKAISANVQNASIVEIDSTYLPAFAFDDLKKRALTEIENHHRNEPLAGGILRETLRERIFGYLPPEIFRSIIAELDKHGKVISEKDIIKTAAYKAELSVEEIALREQIRGIYQRAKFDVPKREDALAGAIIGSNFRTEHARKIFQLLLNDHEIVRVTEEFYFAAAAIDELVKKMREFASTADQRLIDVPKFKEIAGVSRKYAIPLLEYFDREKVTRRAGDKRLIL